MKIGRRLEALERQILPMTTVEHGTISEEAFERWLCDLFRLRHLWFDDSYSVVVGNLESPYLYTGSRGLLEKVATFLNTDWRHGEDGTLQPLLPMTRSEIGKAIELLQSGHVHVTDYRPPGPTLPDYTRITQNWKLERPRGAERIANHLSAAIHAYQASGGEVEPFNTEMILALLTSALEAERV